MNIFLPNTVADCNRKIEGLKKSITDGYKYVEEANLAPHIEKHILKRINNEENHLDVLEKRRKEIIARENDEYEKAVYAVANSW